MRPSVTGLLAAGGTILSLALSAAALSAQIAPDEPLARARRAYNERRFDEAIDAASLAGQDRALRDRADLIAARAYLERLRERAMPEDLTQARTHLNRLAPERLAPRERAELLFALGQALYYEAAPGAAATLFSTLLEGTDPLPEDGRERVLDWWATSVDRVARPRPDLERRIIYQTVRDRMHDELGSAPASGVAAYWLAAAAAGQGDWQAAWDAALAGWVRAPVTADHGAMLRADIDRLVRVAIVPERARGLSLPMEVVMLDWEAFKQRWLR